MYVTKSQTVATMNKSFYANEDNLYWNCILWGTYMEQYGQKKAKTKPPQLLNIFIPHTY